MNNIHQQYAVKWKLPEGTVLWIYQVVQQTGRKYGKTSRALQGFGLDISPRQLKYFTRKVSLNRNRIVPKVTYKHIV